MIARLRCLPLLTAALANPLLGQPLSQAAQIYLVELMGEPMAALAGPAPASPVSSKFRFAEIRRQQADVAPPLTAAGARVHARLENVVNGFIVSATPEVAARLRTIPGVRSVLPDCEAVPASDKAVEMNGIAEAWNWIGGRDLAGEGIRIAFIDSGIVPDHPAFRDTGVRPPPGFPKGNTPQDIAVASGRIIVARHSAPVVAGRPAAANETVTDTTGHGTAVASVAAGTPHQAPFGFLSGVAPKAWLGIYTASGGTSIIKSLDDAIADGMQIVNISFMFTNSAVEDVRSALRLAVDRAAHAGVIVVMPTGPLGPARGTIMDPPNASSVVTVGGTPNSRMYAGSVSFGNGPARQAFPGSNRWFLGSLESPDRLTAPAVDLTTLDATGGACNALPAGSLTGRIVVANFAGCTPEVKLRNLGEAGATGAIFHTANAATAPARFQAGTATLGGVVVGFEDGRALVESLRQGQTTVTIQFDAVSYPLAANMVAPYSGRGPTFDHRIKPDLVAVGDPRYVAAQKTNPAGQLYSPSGYATRFGNPAPSFATATVSGAFAVLMGKRTGLTADHYRSLLINSATPVVTADGSVTPVMEGGAGALNLLAALKNTVAVYPTSLSYGIASKNISQHRSLSITNLGSAAETYTIRAIPFDTAPPLKIMNVPSICMLTDEACIARGSDSLTVEVQAGKTVAVYPRWHATDLAPGEYQGMIAIDGTAGHGVTTYVPYWLGVPSGIPASVRSPVNAFLADPTPFAEYWNEPAANATYPGTEGWLFYLVTDSTGLAITDPAELQFTGTVVAGAGRIGSPSPVPGSFGAIRIPVTLGPSPGANTFRFQFGATPAITATVTAVARP
ncbi:MAG: S8 family serine peptidase [Bryobacterales bacterium]|nr:S8 family serine peptidase [Bryobacterales bacterium]